MVTAVLAAYIAVYFGLERRIGPFLKRVFGYQRKSAIEAICVGLGVLFWIAVLAIIPVAALEFMGLI